MGGGEAVVGVRVKKNIPPRMHNDIITARLHLSSITTFYGMSRAISGRSKCSRLCVACTGRVRCKELDLGLWMVYSICFHISQCWEKRIITQSYSKPQSEKEGLSIQFCCRQRYVDFWYLLTARKGNSIGWTNGTIYPRMENQIYLTLCGIDNVSLWHVH